MPPTVTTPIVPNGAAGTRSGIAWASAPNITSRTRLQTSRYPLHGLGYRAAITVPSGTRISAGRNVPPLIGTSGKMCFSATQQTETVVSADTLRGPLAAGDEPAKSISSESPETVISTAIRSGLSITPSLSRMSSHR